MIKSMNINYYKGKFTAFKSEETFAHNYLYILDVDNHNYMRQYGEKIQ